ncbi:MAG: hypothetical protein WCF77_01320 [Minisyncoccia bacterium]
MKPHSIFFLFGLALGAVIFWLPTAFGGGNGFALPPLFFFGPWYLVAIPYLVIFALIYGILVGIYRLLKRSFPVSLADVAWTLLGLYLALTSLFHFVGVAVGGGKLTI